MRYREKSNWKYEITDDCTIKLNHNFGYIEHDYFIVDGDSLSVKKDYRWDGATCAIDTDNFMVPSLVHDILFQAMRESLLCNKYLDTANRELQLLCIERGMWKIRAWWVYKGVTAVGDTFIKSDIKEVD